jgi:hypothetical protein
MCDGYRVPFTNMIVVQILSNLEQFWMYPTSTLSVDIERMIEKFDRQQ